MSKITGAVPVVADERCHECQLRAACMPDVIVRAGAITRYVEREVLGCQ
jgi:hypothetical protein